MTFGLTRILSDLHYGDPTSRVQSLPSLRPLFEGADRIVFNGDSVETRPGPPLGWRNELRARFLDFVQREVPRAVLVTGNHDADLADTHHVDLLAGVVFVTHGEIFFEDLVPWGPQPRIRDLFARELAGLSAGARHSLEGRMAAGKRACAKLELFYDPLDRGFAAKVKRAHHTIWPPWKPLAMMRAWWELPGRAVEFAARHRPNARFIISGHTHLPGVWRRRGVVVINNGTFCRPFVSYATDVSPGGIVVRRVVRHGDNFILGRVVAAFALAPTGDAAGAAVIVPSTSPIP